MRYIALWRSVLSGRHTSSISLAGGEANIQQPQKTPLTPKTAPPRR
jgi:hypothetical protein